ncbi:MAG: hypothetical protein LBS31_06335 [Candidatus Adiutrix sp.]|jgi:hypothetical protein|nr:hypothetical protein [Candidatus Adiutrix sp.]
MFAFDLGRFGLAANNKATEEFARLKAGFGGSGDSFPMEYVWPFLAGLIIIILLAAVIGIVRRKRRHDMFSGWFAVTEPERIAMVFRRAVAREALFTLEIFDQRHTVIYKGRVVDMRENYSVALELSQTPFPDIDFEGFPVQVHINFRPAPKVPMEHYQFSSRTMFIDFPRERAWRIARVLVSWPRSIISAQRRDFLRLEPSAEHSLSCLVCSVPQEPVADMGQVEEIATAAVLDISVGGAQLVFPGAPGLTETQRYMGVITLPGIELDSSTPKDTLYLLMQLMTQDVIGRGAAADLSDKSIRTIVRTRFLGRYIFNKATQRWAYAQFSHEAFQVLSNWMYAYQRHQLQKEKDLLPSPPKGRVNLYPSIPPERPEPKDD